MYSSSENVSQGNPGREMMLLDVGWKVQCIRLQAKTHPDADYLSLPVLMKSINPMAAVVWREISFLHCWTFHIEMPAVGSPVSQWRSMRSVGIKCKGHDKFFQRHLATTNTDVARTYAEPHVSHYLRKLSRIFMQ
jgi:hypothetical protein